MATDVIHGSAVVALAARLQVGIDAAITANHSACVGDRRRRDRARRRFSCAADADRVKQVTHRLAPCPGVTAVVEPTSMTWLPLVIPLDHAGRRVALVGARHAARLRGAISGKNKSDVIDADVLARAGEVFDLTPLRLPDPTQLALRRAVTRRAAAAIDAQPGAAPADLAGPGCVPGRVERRFGGSLATAKAVLARWPHLSALGAARRGALTRGGRGVDPRRRRRAGAGGADSGPRPDGGRSSGTDTWTWTRWPGYDDHRTPRRPDRRRCASGPGDRAGGALLGAAVRRSIRVTHLAAGHGADHRAHGAGVPRRRGSELVKFPVYEGTG